MVDTEKKNGSKVVIEIRDLSKTFGSQVVLKNINLDLRNGENLVVLGKSGC
jgi:phospholipid/cholesterol/gamma-HCH transport system ATP-binding protein